MFSVLMFAGGLISALPINLVVVVILWKDVHARIHLRAFSGYRIPRQIGKVMGPQKSPSSRST